MGYTMPRLPSSKDLTGRTTYRSNIFGKLILQVEENRVTGYAGRLLPGVIRTPIIETFWRDATVSDLSTLDYIARQEKAKDEGLPPPIPPSPRCF